MGWRKKIVPVGSSGRHGEFWQWCSGVPLKGTAKQRRGESIRPTLQALVFLGSGITRSPCRVSRRTWETAYHAQWECCFDGGIKTEKEVSKNSELLLGLKGGGDICRCE